MGGWVEECREGIGGQRLPTAEVRVPEWQPMLLCKGTLDKDSGGPVADCQITVWPGRRQLVRYKGCGQKERGCDYN